MPVKAIFGQFLELFTRKKWFSRPLFYEILTFSKPLFFTDTFFVFSRVEKIHFTSIKKKLWFSISRRKILNFFMGIDFSFTGGIFGKFPRENFNIHGTFLEMFGLFHGHIFSYGHFFCFSTFLHGYDFYFG